MPINPLDEAIKRTSEVTNKSLEIVEKVISHQWKETHAALSKYKSVEVSGLLEFKIRVRKTFTRFKKVSDMLKFYENKISSLVDEKEIAKIQKIIDSLKVEKAYIETKIPQYVERQGSVGGVA